MIVSHFINAVITTGTSDEFCLCTTAFETKSAIVVAGFGSGIHAGTTVIADMSFIARVPVTHVTVGASEFFTAAFT